MAGGGGGEVTAGFNIFLFYVLSQRTVLDQLGNTAND